MLNEDKPANLGETALWCFNLPQLCRLSQLSSSFEDNSLLQVLGPTEHQMDLNAHQLFVLTFLVAPWRTPQRAFL